MSYYVIVGSWLTVKRILREDDALLLQILRSCVFRQVLDHPLWDGTFTLIEGGQCTVRKTVSRV